MWHWCKSQKDSQHQCSNFPPATPHGEDILIDIKLFIRPSHGAFLNLLFNNSHFFQLMFCHFLLFHKSINSSSLNSVSFFTISVFGCDSAGAAEALPTQLCARGSWSLGLWSEKQCIMGLKEDLSGTRCEPGVAALMNNATESGGAAQYPDAGPF